MIPYFNQGDDEKPTSKRNKTFNDTSKLVLTGIPIAKQITILGRVSTIEAITGYRDVRFKYLDMGYNGGPEWTPEMNHLFITCGYVETQKTNNPANTFHIMLIIDKTTDYTGLFDFDNNIIKINKLSLKQKEQKMKDLIPCTGCVFPPNQEYYAHGEAKEITDKHWEHLPSVTFTEIVILTKYFNMECWSYNYNETYQLYFFCNAGAMNAPIENFNKDKDKKLQKVTIDTNDTTTDTINYKDKYFKYKNKYLELKNKYNM